MEDEGDDGGDDDNVVDDDDDDDDIGCCDRDDDGGGIDGGLELFRFDTKVVSVNEFETATDRCPVLFDDPVFMMIDDVVVGSNFIDDDELELLTLLLLLLLLLPFVDDDDDNWCPTLLIGVLFNWFWSSLLPTNNDEAKLNPNVVDISSTIWIFN